MSPAPVQRSRVITIFRVIVVSIGIISSLLMLKPRDAIGFAFVYLLFLWPVLIGLIVVGCVMPWATTMWRKDPGNARTMFIFYAIGILFVCYLGLGMTSWLR
jgi:hypothetical protein